MPSSVAANRDTTKGKNVAPQYAFGFAPILTGLRRSLEGYRAEIRSRVVDIIRKSGKQEAVAREMGFGPGNFSKVLSGQYSLDVAHLADLRALDETDTFIQFLCSLWGGVFVPKPEVTPEQRLENLLREARRSGVAGEAILKAAGELL